MEFVELVLISAMALELLILNDILVFENLISFNLILH